MLGAFGIDIAASPPSDAVCKQKLKVATEKRAKQFFEQRLLVRENI